MIDLATLLIASLATWRITSLFVNESGPFGVFLRLREWAGIEHDDQGNKIGIKDAREIAELLSCGWCFSFWAGVFVVMLFLIVPQTAVWILAPFALSGAAILIDEHL